MTKTFWYPIIKKIGTSVGLNVTKKTLANGVSKSIPIVGGIISGAITFASMKPMAEKLQIALEKATFHYTEEDLEKDIIVLENIETIDKAKETETNQEKKSIIAKGKEKVGNLFKKKDTKGTSNLDELKKLKELLDIGAITQEEYKAKKKELLKL